MSLSMWVIKDSSINLFSSIKISLNIRFLNYIIKCSYGSHPQVESIILHIFLDTFLSPPCFICKITENKCGGDPRRPNRILRDQNQEIRNQDRTIDSHDEPQLGTAQRQADRPNYQAGRPLPGPTQAPLRPLLGLFPKTFKFSQFTFRSN
jgi:hypothetical protein